MRKNCSTVLPASQYPLFLDDLQPATRPMLGEIPMGATSRSIIPPMCRLIILSRCLNTSSPTETYSSIAKTFQNPKKLRMSFLLNRCCMSGKGITTVIVSNDEGDLEKGKSEGVTGWNSTPSVLKIGERHPLEIAKQYVSGTKNSTELRDRISPAPKQEGAKVTQDNMLYPESMFKMTAGVKAGNLHSGKLNINHYHFHKGSIGVPLALIDEAQVSQGTIGEGKPHPTGWVVGVINRKWRYYVGHLDPSSAPSVGGRSQRNVFLIPMDKKIPKIQFRRMQASELFGKRIGVSIHAWDGTSRYRAQPVVSSGRWERLRLKRQTLKIYHCSGVFSIGRLQGRWWIVCQKRCTGGEFRKTRMIPDSSRGWTTVGFWFAVLTRRAVKTSMMPFTQAACQMENTRSMYTLQMSHISSNPTPQWTMKRDEDPALAFQEAAAEASETSDPIDVKTKEMLETHSLVV
ncbi:hypothetical protein HOY82DRAFT_631042 [Tuber indicum]|nr:hypothetical protein HOY82DRAFT_631042 [Tuber indicum]